MRGRAGCLRVWERCFEGPMGKDASVGNPRNRELLTVSGFLNINRWREYFAKSFTNAGRDERFDF